MLYNLASFVSKKNLRFVKVHPMTIHTSSMGSVVSEKDIGFMSLP